MLTRTLALSLIAWMLMLSQGWSASAQEGSDEQDEAVAAAETGGEADAAEEDAKGKDVGESTGELPLRTLASLRFRSIGPALSSGRISDFAVHPDNRAHYFVAVASGGVWKTTNAGTTYTPVFDGEGSYSIGCVEIDPNNPKIVWVGTGENNSQRSVSFGDGVYKSVDGGKSWTNMGLKESEHIGMILIHPRNGDIVYVAAQGPLWRAGGDRGLYETTDGGTTWERILHVSEDTGINEVHMDPRDPNVLYASAYQRRRRVWTQIDGGPESAIYKSTDAGQTWRKLTRGLPGVDLGRIGMDIAPSNPDIIYAIVEAQMGQGGVYRSTDRGETWVKRNSYMTTSPQYYNEIVCDPNDADVVYFMDTFMHRTEDGGATLERVPRRRKHVDNHALWIDPDDSSYLLVGCDGGVYESFDRGNNWLYKPNLPLAQFYRVTADTSKPFYYVYGGTQDNNSMGGPSRTLSREGILNEDWFVTVGGDGYETVIDPEDPMIVYSLWQYGGLVRHDRRSGETLDIRPRERPGDEPYRWNWDTPLILSPHSHTRLYVAANRLFRSDDRGNSWEVISDDLTRQVDRNQLEVMGKIQSVDAVAKNEATSAYGNCVALSESPVVEGLIYVGTDDGVIQVTEDGGQSWRKIMLFPTVPDYTYVSCVLASQHDPDTVFASFDAHKNGDLTPYVLRSTDRGLTWEPIAGDLPDREVVYSIAEDHVSPDLLFLGTEFGCFFTLNGGEKWTKLRSGLPTIAVRDIDIQERENDLVLATFGRGFYILDDYTPLRVATPEMFKADAHVFPIKDALRYIQNRKGRGSQGASFYSASNPPFGAVFTYHLKESLKTKQERRREREKKAEKAGETPPYPSWQELREEDEERAPSILLIVRDEDGEVVRRLTGSHNKGLHRTPWDLRYPAKTPIQIREPSSRSPWAWAPSGPLATPGTYTVTIAEEIDGVVTELTEPTPFEVVALDIATFAAGDDEAVLEFQIKANRLLRAVRGALEAAGEMESRIAHLRQAVLVTPDADPAVLAQLEDMTDRLDDLLVELRGNRTKARREEPTEPSINSRISSVVRSSQSVTSAPTQMQRDQYRYAAEAFGPVLDALRTMYEEELPAIESQLEEAGAPWTPNRLPDWKPESE
jgi:photosystem II stability/assembly factor-like uncharacterized protein